jgi:GNAT superfamily N-acetyltransferase
MGVRCRGGNSNPLEKQRPACASPAMPRPFTLRVGNASASNLKMLLIRPATVNDAALLLAMIRELAAFERAPGMVTNTEEELARDGFGENPKFRALIAEWSGQPAGYAVFFDYYSTWAGPGLYLEDVYVREAFRGRGVGTTLMAAVARVAVDERRYGIHWSVLDWNEKAIEFYRAMGAEFRDQWRSVLLSGEALQRLGEKAK